MSAPRVCLVAGARPNFIKIAPLIPAFERLGCEVCLVHTGQHYDHQMPCLTVREQTERPITIAEGTNRLVGTVPAAIVAAALEVLDSPPPARRPALWDGRAAERIARVTTSVLRSGSHRRPTEVA